MNYPIPIRFIFSAVLLGATFSGISEDLDAALDAKKKKARRHVYSERALIEKRDILIPKTRSEEEMTLDRDLKRLENQLDRQIQPSQGMSAPRVFSHAPIAPKNWITPTLLDAKNEAPFSPEKAETSWINQELERQKSIHLHKTELAEEEALVNKLLREESRNNYSTEKSPAHMYESILQNQITQGVTPSAAAYSSLDPLGTSQPKENIGSSRPLSLFSPVGRANSGIINPSFSAAPSSPSSSSPQTPSWRPQLGSPTHKSPVDFSRDWKTKKPTPLSPLKRVRQSSPIYRKDPFADDFMSEIKTSIWD